MYSKKELIAEFDRETASTRKLLAAIPADADFTYKPHPKSMSLGNLAGHVSDTAGEWSKAILSTEKMEYSADHKFEPYVPASTKELLERFDKQVAETRAVLVKFAPEKWNEHWKFIFGGQTYIDEPKHQAFRTWGLNHLIHHRAQLGVYLRLLNKSVPGMYGPSADEM